MRPRRGRKRDKKPTRMRNDYPGNPRSLTASLAKRHLLHHQILPRLKHLYGKPLGELILPGRHPRGSPVNVRPALDAQRREAL